MFEHLISFDPETAVATPVIAPDKEGVVRLDDVSPQQLLAAQRASAEWLTEMGADDETPDEIEARLAEKRAQQAFMQVAVGDLPQKAKDGLLALHTPEAVARLTGMLTAYDWEFVERAKELRGFVVARLLEEADPLTGGKASDRIKALTALGKVTEVGLFTEKVEITKKDMSDEELDARIKDRMDRLRRIADALPRPAAGEVEDVTPREQALGKLTRVMTRPGDASTGDQDTPA